MTNQQRPNPDDRSDNVEKLQEMVFNTIQNMERAEESIESASDEQKQQIEAKNERRRESVDAFRSEIKDEYAAQHGNGKGTNRFE